MERKRFVGVIIFGFLFITLAPLINNEAFACSCAGPGSPQAEFSKANTVFIGKVIRIAKKTFGYDYKVKFKVLKSYKGTSEKQFIITSTLQPKSCDYPFKEGEEYLVYLIIFKGKFIASTCGRTRKLSEALEDLKILDSIVTPSSK